MSMIAFVYSRKFSKYVHILEFLHFEKNIIYSEYMTVFKKLLMLLFLLTMYIHSASEGSIPCLAPSSGSSLFNALPAEIKPNILKHLALCDSYKILDSYYGSLLYMHHVLYMSSQNSRMDKSFQLTDMANVLQGVDIFTLEGTWSVSEVNFEYYNKLKRLESNIKGVIIDILSSDSNLDVYFSSETEKLSTLKELYVQKFLRKNLFPIQKIDIRFCQLDTNKWIGLIKSLPTSLKKLNLSRTYSSAESLLFLHRFERLEKLDLSCVKLANSSDWLGVIESLPTSLKELDISLKELDLRSTSPSAASLLFLHRFERLEKLNLSSIKLDNSSDWLGVLESLPTSLKELDISLNDPDFRLSSHSGASLRCLYRLERLEKLSLLCIMLENSSDWLGVIESLPTSLKELDLGNTNTSVEDLRGLYRLERLEKLNLLSIMSGNSSDWLGVIESLPTSLKELDLRCRSPSGASLRGLYRLERLEKLNLPGGRFSNSCDWLGVIEFLPTSLKELDLGITNISVEDLRCLYRLERLEKLNLSIERLYNSSDWLGIIESLPTSLKELDISLYDPDFRVSSPSGASLRGLYRLERLEKLNLKGIRLYNSSDWLGVIESLPTSLKELDLGNTNTSVEDLRCLYRLERLEKLNLKGIRLDNSSDWLGVIEFLPTSLKELDLGYTNISVESLLVLHRLERLETLDLTNVELDSHSDWNIVIESLPTSLKELALLRWSSLHESLPDWICSEELDKLDVSDIVLDVSTYLYYLEPDFEY